MDLLTALADLAGLAASFAALYSVLARRRRARAAEQQPAPPDRPPT